VTQHWGFTDGGCGVVSSRVSGEGIRGENGFPGNLLYITYCMQKNTCAIERNNARTGIPHLNGGRRALEKPLITPKQRQLITPAKRNGENGETKQLFGFAWIKKRGKSKTVKKGDILIY